MIEVRPITPEVIDELLPRLRPIDRLELDCMMPGDHRAGLIRMAERARRSRAAYIDGELIGIFGISAEGILSNTGCPWMLATTTIERHKRVLVDGSQVALGWLMQDFRRAWNVVSVENAAAIRWLRWLGFEFGPTVTVRGHDFRYFWMEKADARMVDRAEGVAAQRDTGLGRQAA